MGTHCVTEAALPRRRTGRYSTREQFLEGIDARKRGAVLPERSVRQRHEHFIGPCRRLRGAELRRRKHRRNMCIAAGTVFPNRLVRSDGKYLIRPPRRDTEEEAGRPLIPESN